MSRNPLKHSSHSDEGSMDTMTEGAWKIKLFSTLLMAKGEATTCGVTGIDSFMPTMQQKQVPLLP